MADRPHAFRRRNGDGTLALAQGLGWFSIGLGVAELVAPQYLARFLGMEERTELIRAYGAREIVTGIGILAQEDPTPWMWGRVGGDVLDLGTLATGLTRDNPQRGNVGLAVAAVAGVMALDLVCARNLGADREWRRMPFRDYSDRRGLPRPPEEMRGVARDAPVPQDMQIPQALRPYSSGCAARRAAPSRTSTDPMRHSVRDLLGSDDQLPNGRTRARSRKNRSFPRNATSRAALMRTLRAGQRYAD